MAFPFDITLGEITVASVDTVEFVERRDGFDDDALAFLIDEHLAGRLDAELLSVQSTLVGLFFVVFFEGVFPYPLVDFYSVLWERLFS